MTKQTSLNEKIRELDELVKYFEQTEKDFDLDKALEKYEAASKLALDIKKELSSYELKINEIKEKYNLEEPEENEIAQ